MLEEHLDNWPEVFAGMMQKLIDDDRSNAFSLFVFNETTRVFKSATALHVPGLR